MITDTLEYKTLRIRELGLCDYIPTWQAMREFTELRTPDSMDEFWYLEHQPVFTLGRNAKVEHLLNPGEIPVVHVDRGGQVTYHGPGQLVVYLLLDLNRSRLGIKQLVYAMEQAIIDYLGTQNINAERLAGAPGIYVDKAKIAALGLRIRRGYSYHGLALNVDMDLAPFARINPCGYADMPVTQLADLTRSSTSMDEVRQALHAHLLDNLGYNVS